MIDHEFTPSAQWLTPPSCERRQRIGSNEWYAFRGKLTLDAELIMNPLLRIAADSKYDLYVNGKLVVREGGLKRGPTPSGTYYDVLDLSDSLQVGENTLAVVLQYFGRQGFSHRDSGMPGLLVDADAGVFSEWKVKNHPCYFDAGYVNDAYRLPENSIGYDARQEFGEWTQSDFDDSAWVVAETVATVGEGLWGELYPREFPQWFWSDPMDYVQTREVRNTNGDDFTYIQCDLPHNAQFVPVIEVETKAGIRIAVTVGQDTSNICSTYITREGVQRHVFPGWINGETVTYKIPSGWVKVLAVQYIESGYPAEFVGDFESGNGVLDTLWEKSRRTLYVTMRDTFMDCPCRERAQWPGDMVVQLAQVPYCLDRTADALVQKGLYETFRWQLENGILYGPVPEGNWRMELPAQMLSVVSAYGVWTYYMNTGDRQMLESIYAGMKRYLDLWQFQKNGLIVYRPAAKGEVPVNVDGVETGTWDWIDWGHQIDCEPALNGWFVLAAEGVQRVARELGFDEDADAIAASAQQVREAIRTQYWNSEKGGFVSDGFEFLPDDRVQALMVLCGAAEAEHTPALLKVFNQVEQACPYMEKYILEAMFAIGEPVQALDRMRRRYRTLVENDNSTLWERWPEASDHPGTINHSWSGGPLTLLSSIVAGIRPLEPGWNRFIVQPQPGDLTQIRCSLQAPQGMVRLEAELAEGNWQLNLTVPAGCVAVLDLSGLDSQATPQDIIGTGESQSFRCTPPVPTSV
ncbi:MAG: alpha-L-rhamnosidase C-terminal domain-containing protein [Opitutae bacterium]|nr:alpha-L-rhamnosidase C-terminal domain-containing protein [Opitutae bacterium]MDG1300928.1 alpha-L-rhamnosidase C-terminal domain-containing protein [Opitutae bacterium]